ncbi:SUVZ03G0685 [Saccharomyces uvarum]|uniref:SUVZ03G0685 protein n=1 Tax=Saccharomyces uvarum TaxID=230603 RepID=A0ABN8WVS4_SACUV|nr:SUVZ03G0685 [Saccharomyces uvarum]
MKDIEAKGGNTSNAQGEHYTSKTIWVLEKIAVLVFIFIMVQFMLIPDLQYLGSKYHIFSGYTGYIHRSSLVLTLLSGINLFFLRKSRSNLNPEEKDPQRPLKTDSLQDDMAKKHLRRFFWLLFSFLTAVVTFFSWKVKEFFYYDQTINARRLLHLLGWEVGMLGSIFMYYQIIRNYQSQMTLEKNRSCM